MKKKILAIGLIIMFMMISFTPTIVADEDPEPNCPEGYVEADSDGDGICDVCDPDEPVEMPGGFHPTQ